MLEAVDMTVREFVDATSSASPTPGGGGIAALTAATGAALISMAASISLKSCKDEAKARRLQAIIEKAKGLQADFVAAVDEDAQVFMKIIAAWKLPKGTEAEAAAKKAALNEAAQEGASQPLVVAKKAYSLFNLVDELGEIGNANVLSDAIMGAIQAQAAIEGAALNCAINLPYITDGLVARTFKEMGEELIEKGQREKQRLYEELRARL